MKKFEERDIGHLFDQDKGRLEAAGRMTDLERIQAAALSLHVTLEQYARQVLQDPGGYSRRTVAAVREWGDCPKVAVGNPGKRRWWILRRTGDQV